MYFPSGDIITMWGFTLFPRKVRPMIFFVLISINERSLESRFTIMTIDVGSETLISAARTTDSGANPRRPTDNPRATALTPPRIRERFILDIINASYCSVRNWPADGLQ